MHGTPVRRPNGKARKRSISSVACVRVGINVWGRFSIRCGVRVQVGLTLKVRVRDRTGCG